MKKKFKCKTFSKDNLTLDYGKEHMLITVQYENGKELAVCLNDKDIDQMIKYLLNVRGIAI